jgi:hypothetical protein
MSGKWVQAENGEDRKLDVYVWVEAPEPTTGTASILEREDDVPSLLGPDGKPLRSKQSQRPMGFGRP